MSNFPFIAIEGVIGVGKTTLARMLAPDFSGEVLLEVFEENPFLSDFYADRARYAFQTQIFFLLSRYRQQHQAVPAALQRGPLFSDYTFAKDALFAHLNLNGDELAVYEKLHTALAEKIPTPDLLVYLRADLDVLMTRIRLRDRPYERSMDPNYIDSLRLAYEGFFSAYTASPVLVIDTNHLNVVTDPADYATVRERIRSALGQGTFQPALPQMPLTGPAPTVKAPPPVAAREADALRDFAALAQSIGNLGVLLSDGVDRPALQDALNLCTRRLTRLAEAQQLRLEV